MFKLDQIKEGVLDRFTIQIPAGTTLFKQNDKGNTLYIVIEGSIKLTHKVANSDRTIANVGPGEIVGEKALALNAPYRRAFTAVAETDSVALEFDSQSLKAIAMKVPDFTLKLLQVVVERLDKANALVGVLQISNPVERVAHYLKFLCEHHSKTSGTGLDITVTAETISSVAAVDLATAKDCLAELVSAKTLTAREGGFHVLDEHAIAQNLSALKTRSAA